LSQFLSNQKAPNTLRERGKKKDKEICSRKEKSRLLMLEHLLFSSPASGSLDELSPSTKKTFRLHKSYGRQ
jgi:hypothetical protein